MLLSLFHKRESWNWKRKGSPQVIQHVNGESKRRLRPSVMSLVKHLFCVYCSWLSCSSHPCPGGGLEDAGLGMKKLESQLEAVFFFFFFFLVNQTWDEEGPQDSLPLMTSLGFVFQSPMWLPFLCPLLKNYHFQCLAMVSTLTFHAHMDDACHPLPWLLSILNSHLQPDSSPQIKIHLRTLS